jgi:NodT family efflux transporter outer membrane factor (OMF) lipoprotein
MKAILMRCRIVKVLVAESVPSPPRPELVEGWWRRGLGRGGLYAATFLLTSCSFAPPYHRPSLPVTNHYKENGTWLKATPASASIDRGDWWRMYRDADLDRLEKLVCQNNQDLKVAVARFEEARSAALIAQAAYYPTIFSLFNASRQGTSSTAVIPNSGTTFNDLLTGLDLSYEVDVWGRVRNTVKSAEKRMKASAMDTASIFLTLQAELAADYFSLRAADANQVIYDQTVRAYQAELTLTRDRYKGGIASISDVYQAKTQYENARTQSTNNRLQRAQLEHAIAILIGEVPAAFSLPPAVKPFYLVEVTPELPSILLERRPDIAAAELRVQAANADIGAARAAYFPAVNLSAGLGFESSSFGNLFRGDSMIWAFGPSTALSALTGTRLPLVSYTVFDGGQIAGLTRQAWAAYHENVAQYRETVLRAFKEVEDSLVALHRLNQENTTQQLATTAANNALTQAKYRYRGGIVNYLEVVTFENLALQARLNLVSIEVRRQIASVQLVKALGGGWLGCKDCQNNLHGKVVVTS